MTAIEKAQAIQTILGVDPDGDIGFGTRAAFDALDDAATAELAAKREGSIEGWRKTRFSSFADPADVRAFEHCKATGKSDIQCFAVGDNGIGQFGKITAQEDVAMVAVHGVEMIRRWGSINAAAHKPVLIRCNGKQFAAKVEDRISEKGRVDLNPACAKIIGIHPPFLLDGEWCWADDAVTA